MLITPRNPSAALLRASLLAATALAPNLLSAQNSAPPAPHAAASAHSAAAHTTTATHSATAAGGGCVKLPDVSPKVPALPASAPCPKALYTLSTAPDIHIEYSAPVEGDLAKTLGIESSSFTLGYIDTRVGSGPPAEPHKWYTVKYTGYLADGTVFDSSDKHPETADGITFQVGEHHVIAGWDTGFAGMKIGGKRRLFIPWQLAYGAQGHPPSIPARAELIFDMELVSQSDTQPAPKTPSAAATPPPGAIRIPSGLPRLPQGARATPPPTAAAPTTATPPASSAPATPPAATAPTAPASAAPATPPPTESK
jgi:peptidylprolyl isomerase